MYTSSSSRFCRYTRTPFPSSSRCQRYLITALHHNIPKMCKFTVFSYDCKCSPPGPVRTSQCLLSKQGCECEEEDTHVALPVDTCSVCIGRARYKRRVGAINDKVEELGLDCEHLNTYPRLSLEECFVCGQRAELKDQITLEASRRTLSETGEEQGSASPRSNDDVYVDASLTSTPQSGQSPAHTSSRQSSDAEETGVKPLPVLDWEVPTRCFIDAGFIRLDPWAADREKQFIRAAIQRQSQCQGLQYTVPYPCPEDLENVDPMSKVPRMPAPELRQTAYRISASTVRAPFCPPGLCVPPTVGVPTVGYQVALAPCCAERTRLWRAKHMLGNAGPDEDRARDTVSDDHCTSRY